MSGTAVVLFNLGGPDRREAIRPYLYNFFMDKNIIRAPLPLRWVAATLISRSRARGAGGRSYAALGYRSPLFENTQAQARALEAALGDGFRVFVCMRYWAPQAAEVARAVKDFAPERVVLLPLYPQYSTTTTRSSFESWDKAAAACGLCVPTVRVCCYPLEEGFVKASAASVRDKVAAAVKECGQAPRVLFSAHGLPEDIVADGDPYQWQCEQAAAAIARAAGLEADSWRICYQSRVGPKQWIRPSTDEELRKAGAERVPVIVYPHAFVSEHVETLVEIEKEYRHLAEMAGVPYFARVETVGTAPDFIAGLAGLVRRSCGQEGLCSATGGRGCPSGLRRCPLGQSSMERACG